MKRSTRTTRPEAHQASDEGASRGLLEERVAIITGGARGQGAAEARRFVDEGATVVVADVLQPEGEALAAELGSRAIYVPLDVTDEDAWARTVGTTIERFGRVDVLVNNAGVSLRKWLGDTSSAEFRRVTEINQLGVFLGMRAVSEHMRSRRRGSMVNISSIAGLRGDLLVIAYGASKWAVRGMSRIAARELGPFGVRVNTVHPGLIETDMLRDLDGIPRDELLATVPLRRVGQAEDVAGAVLWLASDESCYLTGAEIVIDGGITA